MSDLKVVPEECKTLIADVEALLEKLRKCCEAKTNELVSDAELMEIEEKSYSNLLATINQLQDSSSRILATMAFLTAAAAAIYRESANILPGEERDHIFPPIWFGGYILCVSLGALFLLGGLWPIIWKKEQVKDSTTRVKSTPKYPHSFLLLLNIKKDEQRSEALKKEDEEVTAKLKEKTEFAKYKADLVKAFVRDRDKLTWEAEQLAHLFHWGGVCLIAAFFFLTALTSTLFLRSDSELGWFALFFGVTLLTFVLLIGSIIRAGNNWKEVPWVWIWVVILVIGIVVTICLAVRTF